MHADRGGAGYWSGERTLCLEQVFPVGSLACKCMLRIIYTHVLYSRVYCAEGLHFSVNNDVV